MASTTPDLWLSSHTVPVPDYTALRQKHICKLAHGYYYYYCYHSAVQSKKLQEHLTATKIKLTTVSHRLRTGVRQSAIKQAATEHCLQVVTWKQKGRDLNPQPFEYWDLCPNHYTAIQDMTYWPVSVDGDVGGAADESCSCKEMRRWCRLQFCCCSRDLLRSSSLLFSFSICLQQQPLTDTEITNKM